MVGLVGLKQLLFSLHAGAPPLLHSAPEAAGMELFTHFLNGCFEDAMIKLLS